MKKYLFGTEIQERKCEICGEKAVNKQPDNEGNLHDVCLKEDCNKRLYSKLNKKSE